MEVDHMVTTLLLSSLHSGPESGTESSFLPSMIFPLVLSSSLSIFLLPPSLVVSPFLPPPSPSSPFFYSFSFSRSSSSPFSLLLCPSFLLSSLPLPFLLHGEIKNVSLWAEGRLWPSVGKKTVSSGVGTCSMQAYFSSSDCAGIDVPQSNVHFCGIHNLLDLIQCLSLSLKWLAL